MIMRREMLAAVALSLAAGDRVWAQAPTKVWRVGYLNLRAGPGSADHAFVRGMRELGYVEGRNLVIEYRWAANDFSRMQPLADELARIPVDVFVTAATPGVSAAMREPGRIPVVMAAVSDAVSTFGNPAGEHVSVAVFTSGSGAAARTCAALMTTTAPEAMSTAWLIPSVASTIAPTQFGESGEDVLVAVIV